MSRKILVAILGVFACNVIYGQDDLRTLTTSVPFLTLPVDARGAAMGDVGAATSPDAASMFWNPGKLAFIDADYGGSVSYTPWLRNLVDDMSLSYLTAFAKIRQEDAIGVSLTFFNLGQIQFTDNQGNELQLVNPNEFNISMAYSRKLSRKLGVSLGLKYIHSDLTGRIDAQTSPTGTDLKPGNTAAADLAMFYRNDYVIFGNNTNIAFGANLSNLGPKISYSNNDSADFIPTSLKLGTSIGMDADVYNTFTLSIDFNKLLVPSDANSDRGVVGGAFSSFGDSPDGFSGELKEIAISLGLEYNYDDKFFVRTGYFFEDELYGARKYFTVGAGVKYQVIALDLAYLIPTTRNHPLENTLRLTLGFNFMRPDELESVQDES
ncbi:MAG: type IX secretion system outer membrane channel protein PorV [Cytophagales bacterium]|nr:type IX secretion system outer membrane channel protein PorV [Hyphobacterium sp. CCMP332]